MGQCWTVTHAGVESGIQVHGDRTGGLYVPIGNGYKQSGGFSGDHPLEQRSVPHSVRLDKFDMPELQDGMRLTAAGVSNKNEWSFLRRAHSTDQGAVVYVDTRYTSPCVQGGHWEINTPKLVTVVGKSYSGHTHYTLWPTDRESGGPDEYVDSATCYARGILLLMPGGRLTITFKAPGAVVGEVTFDGSELSFAITNNAVDTDYVYVRPNYQAEHDQDALHRNIDSLFGHADREPWL